MLKMLLTSIRQDEVKVLHEEDAPETYAKNLPPGGKGKWVLIEYEDGKRYWHPIQPYTFATPKIDDHGKVSIEVKE